MELIEKILCEGSFKTAIKKVEQKEDSSGVDKTTVYNIEHWFCQHKESLIQ